MKERQEPGFFDSFEEIQRKSETNRQASYENKVCKKILTRFFEKGSSELSAWQEQIGASSEPLSDLQDLMGDFWLTSHRFQSWSINELLASPGKLAKHPIWVEFSERVACCPKGKTSAMLFYNSVVGQDLVIHTDLNTRNPNGYFRMIRSSTSGEGGVVIDTLDGFIGILTGTA